MSRMDQTTFVLVYRILGVVRHLPASSETSTVLVASVLEGVFE